MYFLSIDIAKTNHVASLIDSDGKVVIKTIRFTNRIDGYNVSVYNPFQIKAFGGAFHNRKQKNDAIDAVIIASYLRTFGSENPPFPNSYLLSLKQLTRFRTNLVDTISALKNQTIAILDKVFLFVF